MDALTFPDPVTTARPLAAPDAATLFEFSKIIEAHDHFGWTSPLEEWESEFTNPDIDWPNDSIGLFAADGTLIAVGIDYYTRTDAKQRNFLWGHVHPEFRRRGIGTKLLTWQTAAARDRSPADGSLRLARIHVLEPHEGRRRLVEAHGFRLERYFVDMCRGLDQPVAAPVLPEGLGLELWSEDRDEATRVAVNTAFADHWGSIPQSAESWKLRHSGHPHWRGDLSFLAVDTAGEVVAASLVWIDSDHNAANDTAECWIGTVGTLREWRGRGVATALIRASMEAMATAGMDEAWLGVDTASPTGALSLYERLGFEARRRDLAYVLDL